MITLEFPCTGRCENGKIQVIRNGDMITCNTCQGTGKLVKHIGCIISRDVNMGDHGEMVYSVLDVDSDMTIKDLFMGMFDPMAFQTRDIRSLTFSPTVEVLKYYPPEPSIDDTINPPF